MTSSPRESAKLYEFPTRSRVLVGGHRSEAKPAVDLRAPQIPATSFGSGWYHEAAVQDSDRASKP